MVFLSFVASTAVRAQAQADEPALIAICKALGPSNRDVTAKSCAAFQKQFPASPLMPVVRGLVGWCALQAGDRGEGVTKLFEAMVSDAGTPFSDATTTMARRWLTRLDREKVKVALKKAYTEHVSYPATLDALAKLPEGQKPPLNDRWGRPWRYHDAELKYVRGIKAQKYVLESSNMDRDQDLKDALAKAYDVGTLLKPVKILSREKGHESVSFAAGREPVVLAPGGRYRGVTLVYVGQNLVVLTDDDHWSVMPLP